MEDFSRKIEILNKKKAELTHAEVREEIKSEAEAERRHDAQVCYVYFPNNL